MQLHEHYNTFQPQLQIPMDISYLIDEDDPVFTFLEVIQQLNLGKYLHRKSNRGRKGHDLFSMFSIVTFAFMEHNYSLRNIAKACKTDVRYMYLSNGIKPSYKAICEFINKYILPHIDEIFYDINKKIIEIENLDTSKLLIDGTKYEANANKNTFVWKKAVLHFQSKLFSKISKLLEDTNVYFNLETIIQDTYDITALDTLIHTITIAINIKGIRFVYGKGKRKTKEQRFFELTTEYRSKLVEYQSKLDICGNRNSYSKTDNDAHTQGHTVKWDYYNNTNVFRAGYNVQAAVVDEYILHAGVYPNPADILTFIPFMNDYYKWYEEYPSKICADAGYGSYENYCYCMENDIKPFIKYTMFNAKKTPKFKKRTYNKLNWGTNNDGYKVCPEGNVFDEIISVNNTTKNEDYPRMDVQLGCKGCDNCLQKSKCTKSDVRRTITENGLLNQFHEQVDDNLATETGIELRIRRSIETEGAFGILKNNWDYERIRRRGKERVEMELKLTIIGFNLRKYHMKKYREEPIES